MAETGTKFHWGGKPLRLFTDKDSQEDKGCLAKRTPKAAGIGEAFLKQKKLKLIQDEVPAVTSMVIGK